MELKISNSELSELIADIYDSALTNDWSELLCKLIDITQSNKAFFFLQKLNQKEPLLMEFKANFNYPMESLLEYQKRPFEDPFYKVTKYLFEGDSVYCNEELDLTTYSSGEYYQSILKPMRSHWVMGGILCRDGVHESSFAVNRGFDVEKYDRKDFELIRLITPHFSKSMHIFKELRLYKQYSNITKSIIDQEDKAIILCDPKCRVILQNDYTKNYLLESKFFNINNEKLSISLPIFHERFEYLVRICSDLSFREIGTQESLVIYNENESVAVINVSPIRTKHTFTNLDTACCLVTVTLQKKLNWRLLENEFSLTKKELCLLKGLYSKKRLFELTETMNASYNTLRVHLKSIFRKMKVNSQSELMIKLNDYLN